MGSFKANSLLLCATLFAALYSHSAVAATKVMPRSEPPCKLCPANNPWKKATKPTSSPPEAIGKYDAGCLRGAQNLEPDGVGFQVMRPNRNRAFSHPTLLSFIKNASFAIKAKTGQDLLVGDMGQARGGPSFSGHASHQTGLDVDLWYWQPKAGTVLTSDERNKISARALANSYGLIAEEWDPKVIEMVKIAAESPNVERIFVNPVIKKAVCEKYAGAEWVRHLRPWYFHHDHFHVRLACPQNSPLCVKQESIPPGDGCGNELKSWLTQAPHGTDYNYMSMNPPSGPIVIPVLPAECDLVLKEKTNLKLMA